MRLDGDPPDWMVVRRMTLACLLPDDDRVALTPNGTLPSDRLRPGEHPLDACRRIPLELAGFRCQHFHPFALDGDHLIGWVEGYVDHAPPVEPVIGRPSDPEECRLVDAAGVDHAALAPETYLRESVRTLERAYLAASTPQGQSGFGRDEPAWQAARLEVADAIDFVHTLLDSVPTRLVTEFIDHQLAAMVVPGGRLIVSEHGVSGRHTDEILRLLGYDVGRFCPSDKTSRPAPGSAWIEVDQSSSVSPRTQSR